jgi:MFS family permease
MFFLQLSFVLAGDGITSPVTQSNVMMAITAMNFLGGLVYGRILERIGTRWMFVLILGTMAAAHLLVGASGGIPMTVLACGLAGLGGGSLVPYITNLVLSQAPADMRGRAIGFQYTVMYIGDFMNPLIVTPMRGEIGNHAAFAVIGALLAAAAIAQAFLRRPLGTPMTGPALL